MKDIVHIDPPARSAVGVDALPNGIAVR